MLQAQQRIASNNFITLRIAAAQQSASLRQLFDHRTLLGIQGGYYYNTMFGPVGATIGYSNRTKKPYLYLNIGYQFKKNDAIPRTSGNTRKGHKRIPKRQNASGFYFYLKDSVTRRFT